MRNRKRSGVMGALLACLGACGGKSTRSAESDPKQSPTAECETVPEEYALFATLYCDQAWGCRAERRATPAADEQVAACVQDIIEQAVEALGADVPAYFDSCIENIGEMDCDSAGGRALLVRELEYGEPVCLTYASGVEGRQEAALDVNRIEDVGDPPSGSDGCLNPGLRPVDGACQPLPGEGEECDSFCQISSPLVCDSGVCVVRGRQGESCSGEGVGTCDSYFDLRCVDQVCRPREYAGAGDYCGTIEDYLGDEYLTRSVSCAPDLICANYNDLGRGTCFEPVGIGEECNYSEFVCEEAARCNEEQVCEAIPPFCLSGDL